MSPASANARVVILRLVMLVAIVVLPAAILNVPRLFYASDAGAGCQCTHAQDNIGQLRRQRIISYSPSVTDIVVDLGLLDNLVGVTSWCELPDGVSVTRVGSESTLNSEALLALDPDVIFIQQTKDRFLPLMKMRPDLKVVSVSHDSIEGISSSIRTIADTVGYSARGDKLAKQIMGRVEQIRQRCINKPKRRVLFLMGYDHPATCGRNTYLDEIISVVGGVNAAGENYKGWPAINAEMIVKLRPDVIVCQVNPGQEAGARKYLSAFKQVPAISEGRLHITANRRLTLFGSRVLEDVILPFERYVHGAKTSTEAPDAAEKKVGSDG